MPPQSLLRLLLTEWPAATAAVAAAHQTSVGIVLLLNLSS